MEMKELRREVVSGEFDVEAGQSTSGSQLSGHPGDIQSHLGERGDRRISNYSRHSRHNSRHSRHARKEPPPAPRLGEGKLTGPMRFITCYASAFTFVVMTAIIVGLLLISPPFNVEPEILPGRTVGRGRSGDAGMNATLGNATVISAKFAGDPTAATNVESMVTNVVEVLGEEYEDGDGE